MKIITEKTEKLVKVTRTKTINICDKCGRDIDKVNNSCRYRDFESTFKIESGQSYPGGGYLNTLKLDLCEDCSDEAIYLLRENGFKFQELED